MIRSFDTGATRDTEEGKLDYEGFFTPRVLEAYARYMNFNRTMRDGSIRASDNWRCRTSFANSRRSGRMTTARGDHSGQSWNRPPRR